MSHAVQPPVATQKDHIVEANGDKRSDPYFWMRERDSKPVLDYLKAENEYFEEEMKPYQRIKKQIYDEIRGRTKEDEDSLPYRKDAFYYFTRFRKGEEYPVHYRAPAPDDRDAKVDLMNLPKAQVLFDTPAAAKGHKYYQIGRISVSPNQRLMAYAVDTVGRRFYNIHFRDLETKKDLPLVIEATTGSFAWANDNKTFFFVKQNPATLRAEKVFRSSIDSKEAPVLVFEEKDEAFEVTINKSLNQQTIFIDASSTLSSETNILDANAPLSEPKVFLKKEAKHEYTVFDGSDRYFVLSNWKAKNFQIFEVMKTKATNKKNWKVLIAHRPNVFVEDLAVFSNHLVVKQRQNALSELIVYKRGMKRGLPIQFKDEAYDVSIGINAEYDTDVFRYDYESLSQPPSIYEMSFETRKSKLLRTKEVPNYDPSKYQTLRLFATVRDGAKVPITLLVKKGYKAKGKNPLYVYGYGSYGISMDPNFDKTVISLVDRGFAYAILHIRGGSDKGRPWYEDGKLLKKKNTFHDFIDATEFLLKKGYGQKGHVYAMGGSAGGLLMGAVLNMRPDLYNGVVAVVPFVDIVTTMLDDTIPLTTFEYDEWGNPNIKKFYKYMLSYSPYDNVREQIHSNLLVSTGYHDSQVQYWEPAKWVAKLRVKNKGPNWILFRTDMDAGHSGASGRFKSIEEDALYYSFFVALEEKASKP